MPSPVGSKYLLSSLFSGPEQILRAMGGGRRDAGVGSLPLRAWCLVGARLGRGSKIGNQWPELLEKAPWQRPGRAPAGVCVQLGCESPPWGTCPGTQAGLGPPAWAVLPGGHPSMPGNAVRAVIHRQNQQRAPKPHFCHTPLCAGLTVLDSGPLRRGLLPTPPAFPPAGRHRGSGGCPTGWPARALEAMRLRKERGC